MIKSFNCKETRKIFNRYFSKKFSENIQRKALLQLKSLNQARTINDLRNPPANHLEKLSGNRSGQYSIRINKKWRICFNWIDNNANDVEVIDYH